jgi:enolase
MTTPNDITLIPGAAWLPVAEGPGAVQITAHVPEILYTVATSQGAANAVQFGAAARQGQNEALELDTGERLYLKGRGVVHVIAEVPV